MCKVGQDENNTSGGILTSLKVAFFGTSWIDALRRPPAKDGPPPPTSCIDLRAQLDHQDDVEAVIEFLRAQLGELSRPLGRQAPLVELEEFNLWGAALRVRVYCAPESYHHTLLVVREEVGRVAVPIARTRIRMKFSNQFESEEEQKHEC